MRYGLVGAAVLAAAWIGTAWAQETPQRLNNLVLQILHRTEVEPGAVAFTNPREGWVYVAVALDEAVGGEAEVLLDNGATGVAMARAGGGHGDRGEGMRFLPAGGHTLRLRVTGAPRAKSLVVRSVPELQYSRIPAEPYMADHGPRDQAFLEAHILPHVNTVLGAPDHPFVDAWVARGGKWIAYGHVPQDRGMTAEDVYRYWVDNPGIQDPRFAGIIADEFMGRHHPLYPAWIEALRRIGAAEAFAGKAFYAYCGGPGMYSRPQTRELVRTVFGIHSYMAWERYLHEMPTLEAAEAFLDSHLGEEMKRWRATFPGCERRLVMVAPIFTLGLSMNVQPQVDYKAWIDRQIRYYATNPAFDGLFGLQFWTADFADEELLRWAYRLFRHYGIEGNTDLLSERYGYRYALDHIVNPDFDQTLDGWDVEPAAEDRVAWGYMERLANLQGRYWLRQGTPDIPAGNTYLWMKRHAGRPNRVSQQVRGLEPGRLYSAKLISADYGDIINEVSEEKRLGLSLRVEGAEAVPERGFQGTINTRVSAATGDLFDQGEPAWFNHHRVVFRATGETARLVIEDWASPQDPGGPVDQELMCNFVEVQPYFLD